MMNSSRVWLFRVLTLAGAGLFLVSWSMPWWTAYVDYLHKSAVYIRPWGVDMLLQGEYAAWLPTYEMPEIFAPAMWAYLGLCMAALLLSMIIVDTKRIGLGKLSLPWPTALVLGVGFSYVVCVVVALIVMQLRLKDFFDAPLIGSVFFRQGEVGSNIDTTLLPGYYLACVTGPVLIVLALLRKFIVGERKS